MEPVKATKLWSEAYQALRREIRAMASGHNRLPSEEELAKKLEVSRATVREAMYALEQEGYATRRHGKGNFGHPSVASLPHRIDLKADFLQLLSTESQQATSTILRYGHAPASPSMASRFPRPCGAVFAQVWRYSLGSAPMILCRVETPASLLPPDPPLPSECRLGPWLSTLCNRDVAYYATHIGCLSDAQAAADLDLPAGSALLNWQEIVYDIHDEPVSFCDLYFHPSYTDLSMVLRV